MDKKNWEKFLKQEIAVTAFFMLLVAVLVVCIDPFFHYHEPIKGFSYIMDNERYQNDGIVKNFKYDALITGTSVSENFKTSLADELFDATFVKATYAGGYYKEIGDGERRALEYNPDIRIVIRSMDAYFALTDKDYRNPGAADPTYLYDNNVLNDDAYIYNADVLFDYVNAGIIRSLKGVPSDDFDSYMRFAEDRPPSAAKVLATFGRRDMSTEDRHMTEEEKEMLLENIRNNLTANIAAYPDVEFYYYFPPYSIADWYSNHVSKGELHAYIELMEIIAGEVLAYDNAHVFCFYDDTDLVTNLDNYSDMHHYSGEISDMILEKMAAHESELTRENYKQYFKDIEEFYGNYDYELMWTQN